MQKNSHLYFVTSFIFIASPVASHTSNVEMFQHINANLNGLILLLDFANKILEKWNRLAKNTGLIYNVILFKKVR